MILHTYQEPFALARRSGEVVEIELFDDEWEGLCLDRGRGNFPIQREVEYLYEQMFANEPAVEYLKRTGVQLLKFMAHWDCEKHCAPDDWMVR